MRKALLGVLVGTMMAVSGVQAAQAVVATQPESPMATFNGDVSDMLYVGDTIYVGGLFTEATDASGTVVRRRAAAISASTGRLLPWNPKASGAVNDIAALPDGSIALGGTFGTVSGMAHKNIAVVDGTTGRALESFTASADAKVRAVEVGPSGRLYVGGVFTHVDGQSRKGLAAFDRTGTGAWTLADWGPQANGSGPAVIALKAANGVLYVGGKFSNLDGRSGSGYLTSVDLQTGEVLPWNPPVSYLVNEIEADATTVYAAADGPGGHLRAQDASTGADVWDLTADGGFQAVTVMGDEVYFGGHFGNVCASTLTGTHGACQEGQVPRQKMGMVSKAGVLQDWAPVANSALGVHSMENNGVKLGVGGTFTRINGQLRPSFAQFSPTP
jgi:Domain of unknown function (DUF5122) beta-propeller